MRRFFSLLAAVAFAASLTACGSSECDKVKDVCADCDGLSKSLCEVAAALLEQANDEDACKEWNEAGSEGACGSAQ
jgi:hypothetical protein